ncbi:MAG TPA: RNase adapter RapZ [Candidatus Binatia bacterium]|nr:RNase adapter RapZ [Candidatus Binatia bacterium]
MTERTGEVEAPARVIETPARADDEPAGGTGAAPGAAAPGAAAAFEPDAEAGGGSGGPHVVLLSGLSGGGKTAAAKLFEDLAYIVVDNLPGELLGQLAELVVTDPERFARVAVVLDVRAGDAETAYRAMRGALEGRGIRPQVFFLEASDEAIIRRFSETRHRHPLADGRGTQAAITLERRLLDPIRAEADVVLDTTDLPLRDLRERLFARLGDIQPDAMTIQLISFGFKFGIPLEADLVFDARFIENPYYVPELRDHSGLTAPVREFVLSKPGAEEYLDHIQRLLEFSIPAYTAEGKSRLTIAIGCTGGRHRSIVLAEELARRLREAGFGPIAVFHRELERA